MNPGVDEAANTVLGLLSFVLLLAVYAWVAVALAAMFAKMGEEKWRAWVPVLNVAVKIGDGAALWADRLSPLWVAIAPLGYGLGYRQGQAIRTKINTSIMIGDQRRKKRERKERKARQNGGSPQRLI